MLTCIDDKNQDFLDDLFEDKSVYIYNLIYLKFEIRLNFFALLSQVLLLKITLLSLPSN